MTSQANEIIILFQVFTETEKYFISSADPRKSNWLRYIRPSPSRADRNLTVTVKDKQLYFLTITDIEEGRELLYWIDDPSDALKKKKIDKSCKYK